MAQDREFNYINEFCRKLISQDTDPDLINGETKWQPGLHLTTYFPDLSHFIE